MGDRIDRAVARARQDAQQRYVPHASAQVARPRRRAIGDPQAPLEKFLAILEGHALLGDDGKLAPDVLLVSLGDHFDWGGAQERQTAAADALAILSWLAAHPPDQVVLLLGNHDLARVAELADLDLPRYQQARAEADRAYRGGHPDPGEERAFVARYPFVGGSEALARDLSSFEPPQRERVRQLLEARRFRLAFPAAEDLLLVHAAVTDDDLSRIGVPPQKRWSAPKVAQALNGFFDRLIESWDGSEPLELSPLDRTQSAATGKGRGILHQRPAHPAHSTAEELDGPPRRRFDPRGLPPGLIQVVAHVRDGKCRQLLRPWVDTPEPPEGALRRLITDGDRVGYGPGPALPAERHTAQMLFADGGMYWTPAERYALVDLDTRGPAARAG